MTAAFIGSSVAAHFAARALRLPVGFGFDVTMIGIALGLAYLLIGGTMLLLLERRGRRAAGAAA